MNLRKITKQRSTLFTALALIMLAGSWNPGRGEEAEVVEPFHDRSVFLVAPLFGWNRNELKVPPRGPLPATTLTDTGEEYGLFALYASPHLTVNNMFFSTRANKADIRGNLTFLNLYGDPEALLTWNAGAGYLWHKIKTNAMDINISVPITKLGALIRLPGTNLSLNPYLGYSWEHVKTGYSDRWTDVMLYGITTRWYWRMTHVTAKYYLEENLDRNERYNVVRVRSSCFMTEHIGITIRFEYMEHSIADNTSFLFGPAFIF